MTLGSAAPRGPADRSASGGPCLRIGVSTRALFDLAEEHAVFETLGALAYGLLQRSREEVPMAPGRGFDLVSRLLALNAPGPRVVEVVLVSRNPPDLAMRAFASIAHHGLAITTGSFTGGSPLAPFLRAWELDLLLCDHPADVAAALAAGVAAARLAHAPPRPRRGGDGIRIALDGDCVLFCDEADRIHEEEGLEAFLRHEGERAATPLADGPFAGFLRNAARLRRVLAARGDGSGVRIALVTARSAPAHARALNTLRAWGVEVDEAHFVGGGGKAAVLAAFDADVFFDDRERHVDEASALVTAALVGPSRGRGTGQGPRGLGGEPSPRPEPSIPT